MGGGPMINYANYFVGSTFFSAPGMARVSPKLVGYMGTTTNLQAKIKMHQPSPPLIFDRSLIYKETEGFELLQGLQFIIHTIKFSNAIIRINENTTTKDIIST